LEIVILALHFVAVQKRYRVQLLLALSLFSMTLVAGCGGGSSSTATSPANSQTSTPPTIVTPPTSLTVAAGQTATFNVVASGTSALTYQWMSNGTAISGATSASYTTPATTAQLSGTSYDVVVTNAVGSVTSSVAVLTVTGGTPSSACTAVPSAPTGLVASAASVSVISLSWTAATAPTNCSISSYNVYGSATSGFTPSSSSLLAAGVTGTSYSNTGLTASSTHYYLVEALDADGMSAASNQASATTSAAPGTGAAPVISAQPASQSVTIGTTATFTVTASGTGPFTYQWQKKGTAIAGATAASYNTPATSAPDDGADFNVVVSNASGSVTSANAVLKVNSSPAYTVYPGFIGTDLNNNTHGAWRDDQIYIEILGSNVTTGALSWVNYDGTVTAASIADNTAANSVTGPDGHTYPNYAFTLAQSRNLLKLPPLNGGRIFVSLGAPMYIPIQAGNPLGYAGPNPLNAADPNSNTHYDWYEFDWGGTASAIFINTTQVDDFGLPMTLDVWGNGETFHQQTGITESIADLDKEFAAQTPAAFQAGQGAVAAVSPLRIWAPAHMTFGTGGANANYLDAYVNAIWAQYATTPLLVFLNNNSHEYTGTTSGTTFNFTEVNLNNGAYAGPQTYSINKPSTQDLLLCAGSMAYAASTLTGQEAGVTLALEAQFCAAFNRHVMGNYVDWTIVPHYYQAAPANYYAAFWHAHSIAGLSYGFAYDDVNNQSSSIVGAHPEHMAFGISY
jgi:beta-galactosidase